MAQIKDMLLDTLNDLRSGELQEFQWHLKNGVEGLQGIPMAKIEKAERCITVDKIVQSYGNKAVEITVAILKKIKNNDLAEKLETKYKEAVEKGEVPQSQVTTDSQSPDSSVLAASLFDPAVEKNEAQQFQVTTDSQSPDSSLMVVSRLDPGLQSPNLSPLAAPWFSPGPENRFTLGPLNRHSAQSAVEDQERIFNDLTRSFERKHREMRERFRAQEPSRAEQLLGHLEQEMAVHNRRGAEMEQFFHTDMPFPQLQQFRRHFF